jgi:CheY-like chemotaxis protein
MNTQPVQRRRHPPSGELWKFCLWRLREQRGPEMSDRNVAQLMGYEHSRARRWKNGDMYVDRAEFLVRLSDALNVDTMLLVMLAAGQLMAEQAQRQMGRAVDRGVDKRRPRMSLDLPVCSPDASPFAIDPARLKRATRGTVLLIASSGEGRLELSETLSRHPDTGGLVAPEFSMGLCLAERFRPELVLLDLGLASAHAFDACRVLAGLVSRLRRRCTVVAGVATVTVEAERSALMAGAARVAPFPFSQTLMEGEINRLAQRLGPSRPSSARP